jgi:hypothetical protein
MNYAEYGELYRLIEVNPLMSEKTARFFFRKLVRCKLLLLIKLKTISG